MSEKVSIQEAGKSRNFNGVGVIETETPEGESCFWVPESERELETEYVIKNGTYRPKKYGFSDINVNVFDLTTDLDGNDWKIDIGDIELPDFDIDLSLDLDGMPDIEFGIHIITVDDDEIKVVLPGGEEIVIHGPSLTDPVVILDAIEISYDPSTGEWTVTALVECTVGETTYNPGDVIKTWPGTEKVDFYIHAGIALPDLSEIIDLDAGFDVSLDVGDASGLDDIGIDISGLDLDGLPIDVDIDLGDLSIDITELPDEIRIMHVPDKTRYKEGEAIELDGLVVQAYRSGEVWEDKEGKYYNGYVPVHELNIDPLIAHEKNKYRPGGTLVHTNVKYTRDGIKWDDVYERSSEIDTGMAIVISGSAIDLWLADTSEKDGYGRWKNVYNASNGYHEEFKGDLVYDVHPSFIKNDKRIYYAGPYFMGYVSDPYKHYSYENVVVTYSISGDIIVVDGYENIQDFLYNLACGNATAVTVSWARPHDNKILTKTFDISVEEGEADTGTHYSGTWETDSPSGHWGGTTISGNYGGSHHSGKF